jgi:hypothetical protein
MAAAARFLILPPVARLPQHVKKDPSEALQAAGTRSAASWRRDGTAQELSGIRLLASGEEALRA